MSKNAWQHVFPQGPVPERVYSLRRLLSDAGALLRRRPPLLAYYTGQRVSSKLREQIFVAVSAVNACRYCSYLHRDWARAAGVSEQELAALTGIADSACLDAKTLLLLNYAMALADADFGTIDPQLARAVVAKTNQQERDDVENLARIITLMNRAGNSVDLFVLGLRDRKLRNKRFKQAVPIALPMAAGMLTFVLLWSLLAWRSPLAIVRGLGRFSQTFAGEGFSRSATSYAAAKLN